MPTKRTKAKQRRGHITREAAEAFLAGDRNALRRSLGLRPWEFTLSATEDRCRTADEIMANREQIEAELNDWERL